jgi:hypothetical protein
MRPINEFVVIASIEVDNMVLFRKNIGGAATFQRSKWQVKHYVLLTLRNRDRLHLTQWRNAVRAHT